MDKTMRVFYRNLENRRRELGLSQTILAGQAEISPGYYTDLKKGRVKGTEETRRKLAAAVGEDYTSLLYDTDAPHHKVLAQHMPERILRRLKSILLAKLPDLSLDDLYVYEEDDHLLLIAQERRFARDGGRYLIGERVKTCRILPDGQILLLDGEDVTQVESWDDLPIVGEVIAKTALFL